MISRITKNLHHFSCVTLPKFWVSCFCIYFSSRLGNLFGPRSWIAIELPERLSREDCVGSIATNSLFYDLIRFHRKSVWECWVEIGTEIRKRTSRNPAGRMVKSQRATEGWGCSTNTLPAKSLIQKIQRCPKNLFFIIITKNYFKIGKKNNCPILFYCKGI